MAKDLINTSVSVHQRLLDRAKETGRPFGELLQHFAIERFLYRFAQVPEADRFLLKGALMFKVWTGVGSRPTKDIDLLGKIDNNLEVIVKTMEDACQMKVVEDGLEFNPHTIQADRITAGAEYEGVRCRIQCSLGRARISLQIDIGFGDAVIPGPCRIQYPAILNFPPPEMNGYTKESTIAEKFQSMVQLGILNSRMKDIYDIWFLSRTFDFRGEVLAEAVKKTFETRNTPIQVKVAIFDSSFLLDQNKRVQWSGFLSKARLTEAPSSFEGAIAAIRIFLEPVVISLLSHKAFLRIWSAPGPWR